MTLLNLIKKHRDGVGCTIWYQNSEDRERQKEFVKETLSRCIEKLENNSVARDDMHPEDIRDFFGVIEKTINEFHGEITHRKLINFNRSREGLEVTQLPLTSEEYSRLFPAIIDFLGTKVRTLLNRRCKGNIQIHLDNGWY